MKKIFSFIFIMLMSASVFSQTNITDFCQDGENAITVRKEKKVVSNERYLKVTNSGDFGGMIHCNYVFSDAIEVGGSVFYKFGGVLNGDFGVSAGFDYGTYDYRGAIFNELTSYSHVRFGITAGRHIGLGVVFGGTKGKNVETDEILKRGDYGVYVTGFLPIRDRCFGFMFDTKWTRETGFGLGAGMMVHVPVNFRR